MSGVVGYMNLDGRPAERDVLRRMLEAIAHRGSDGEGSWLEGPVALGHRLLYTTPESRHDRQPLVSPECGVIIVCDGRIDNRVELRSALEIRGVLLHTDTDTELVLRAYEQWGVACPERLTGDFAFVLWDQRHQRLVCARDPFGIKPLYYFSDGARVLWASEIKALRCVPGVPTRINEAMVADKLLSDFRYDYHDPEATFFEGIKQLRPAHTLRIERRQLFLSRYWQPTPSTGIIYSRDEEYADHFRDLFQEAVRCRLRSSSPVGVALSGGIDSTLVTTMAEHLRRSEPSIPSLTAFTALFGGMFHEEWSAIQRLIDHWGTTVRTLERPTHPFALFELSTCRSETPQPYGFLTSPALFRAANAAGCRVLLTGFAADELMVTSETGLLEDLLREGDLMQLAREIWRMAESGRDAPSAILIELLSDRVSWRMRRSIRRFLGRHIPRWIAPPFAARVQLAQRSPVQSAWTFPRLSQERSLQALIAPNLVLTLNQMDETAAASHTEWRFPYLDRRLVEFFLAIPPDVKRRAGYRKAFAQRALRDVMPGPLRERVGETYRISLKHDQADRTLEGQRIVEALGPPGAIIFHYVEATQIAHMIDGFVKGDVSARTPLWRLVSLADWMRNFMTDQPTVDTDRLPRDTTLEVIHERDCSGLPT